MLVIDYEAVERLGQVTAKPWSSWRRKPMLGGYYLSLEVNSWANNNELTYDSLFLCWCQLLLAHVLTSFHRCPNKEKNKRIGAPISLFFLLSHRHVLFLSYLLTGGEIEERDWMSSTRWSVFLSLSLTLHLEDIFVHLVINLVHQQSSFPRLIVVPLGLGCW